MTPEKFWAQVNKLPGVDSCWLWTGNVSGDGYGMSGIFLGEVLVHRLAFTLAGEPFKKHSGLVVQRHCGTKLCVRRSHLYIRTTEEMNAIKKAAGIANYAASTAKRKKKSK